MEEQRNYKNTHTQNKKKQKQECQKQIITGILILGKVLFTGCHEGIISCLLKDFDVNLK